jgi:outer membrane beta-barrel protein
MIQALLFALFTSGSAQAADPAVPVTELGVLRQDDVTVVQKILYPKKSRAEFGVHLAVMPFDPYSWAPNLQLSFDQHLSEKVSVGAVIGGGYGLPTGQWLDLASPTYGVAVYSYRYLGSALAGVAWAPIYAKARVSDSAIVHFDLYGAARAGATAELSMIPGGGVAVSPTVSLAIGSRVFLNKGTALRLEIRDDVLFQYRKLTEQTRVKQNANLQIGVTFLGPSKASK